MRVHPGVGSPLWRITPKGGVTICGYFIPEGTEVGVSAWAVHQDKKVFGEDSNLFRPERWLCAEQEKIASMDRSFLSVRSHVLTSKGNNHRHRLTQACCFSLALVREHVSVSANLQFLALATTRSVDQNAGFYSYLESIPSLRYLL